LIPPNFNVPELILKIIKKIEMKYHKYYVVWKGRVQGIFTSWRECKKQILGFSGAQFKSFPTKKMAEEAFRNGPALITFKNSKHIGLIENSLCVGGTWNFRNNKVQYQGINIATFEQIFNSEIFEGGSRSAVEFSAIVHALDYCI